MDAIVADHTRPPCGDQTDLVLRQPGRPEGMEFLRIPRAKGNTRGIMTPPGLRKQLPCTTTSLPISADWYSASIICAVTALVDVGANLLIFGRTFHECVELVIEHVPHIEGGVVCVSMPFRVA